MTGFGGLDFAETKVIGNRAYQMFFQGDCAAGGSYAAEDMGEIIDVDFVEIAPEPEQEQLFS